MYLWEFIGNLLGIVHVSMGIHVYMGIHGKIVGNSTCIYGNSWEICWVYGNSYFLLGIVHVYMGIQGKFIGNSTCIYGNSWEIYWE